MRLPQLQNEILQKKGPKNSAASPKSTESSALTDTAESADKTVAPDMTPETLLKALQCGHAKSVQRSIAQ